MATRLIGSFSSEAQSRQDRDFFDVRLHTAPIWRLRADGPWLYVEQAMAAQQDKPYRQRIYRLVSRADGTVESQVFEVPNAVARVGAWRNPAAFDADLPESLIPRLGCSVFLRRESDAWIGATAGKDCLSSLRGASYATSEVWMRADGLDTWDRGFDASGLQVWGSTRGAYRFRRLEGEGEP